MVATRWFWAVTLGSILAISVVAVPAAAWYTGGHFPFGSSGGPGHPGWANESGGYAVTFTETGLPAGTQWTVSVQGSPHPYTAVPAVSSPAWGHGFSNSSTGTTVSFELRNGTYSYSIPNATGSTGVYAPTPASGTFTVNGSAVSVAASFALAPYYALSFTETGLPTGTWWSVAISSENQGYGGGNGSWGGGWGPDAIVVAPDCQNQGQYASSNTSTITVFVANATYDYSIGNVSTWDAIYVPSPSAGNATVNGSAVNVPVTFAAVPLFALTFSESGLPNGASWAVSLTSANWTWLWNASSNSGVSFYLQDGTYNFSIAPVYVDGGLFLPSPANGTVTVDGSAVDVAVSFTGPALYTLTFSESGLPTGANWSVAIFHGPGPCAPFACWAPAIAPAWGGPVGNTSNSSSVTFTVANGTYDFFVPVVCVDGTLYIATPSSGNVTVNGTSVEVSISFAPIVFSTVTVNETGLPNGTSWFVAVHGASPGWTFGVSNNTTLTFVLPSGTYGFAFGPAWSNGTLYSPTPSAESVTVSGTALTLDVTYAS